MNRTRLLALAAMLMFALTTVAQQADTNSDAHAAHDSAPNVEKHTKLLTEKLDLTSDQQTKIKPILQEMQDATQKSMQDESMSRDERMDNVKASRYKADKKIREMLTDDQKKKLDQLEQEPHPELHGNTNGAQPPSPQGSPQN
jgi:Spy/CpxP family protein refolding chaperone